MALTFPEEKFTIHSLTAESSAVILFENQTVRPSDSLSYEQKKAGISVEAKNIELEMIRLTNLLRRHADNIIARRGGCQLSGTQSFIANFIYAHQMEGIDVYQKDVEREFCISRSTVSGILKMMEQNGTIRRLPVDRDARLKKLVLTEDTLETIRQIHQEIASMDLRVEGCLTEEERRQMREYLSRMRKAAEELSLDTAEL